MDYGGPMMGDLEDGIDQAIVEGVSDPRRIAVEGASYGGDAAPRLATAERVRVACASAGLTYGNMTTPGGGLNIYAVGDQHVREERSPDRFTERLTGPVLVWTGG